MRPILPSSILPPPAIMQMAEQQSTVETVALNFAQADAWQAASGALAVFNGLILFRMKAGTKPRTGEWTALKSQIAAAREILAADPRFAPFVNNSASREYDQELNCKDPRVLRESDRESSIERRMNEHMRVALCFLRDFPQFGPAGRHLVESEASACEPAAIGWVGGRSLYRILLDEGIAHRTGKKEAPGSGGGAGKQIELPLFNEATETLQRLRRMLTDDGVLMRLKPEELAFIKEEVTRLHEDFLAKWRRTRGKAH